jgi:hypothetical protein
VEGRCIVRQYTKLSSTRRALPLPPLHPSMASSPPPSTASPTSSSPYRKLLHSLIYWAVQRCRMSESPCRLTVSVKRSPEPAGSSPLRISVSDTGVGSKLEEFLELDALARETPVEKWGMRSPSLAQFPCLLVVSSILRLRIA